MAQKTTYSAGDKTKEKILEVSQVLFYEKGYEDTSYKDISEMAGVNKALIPYHYNSKLELALAVYKKFIQEHDETFCKISCGEDEEILPITMVFYYYYLLMNENIVRFVHQISKESFFHNTFTGDEERVFARYFKNSNNLDEKQKQYLIRLIWAMEAEIVDFICLKKISTIDDVKENLSLMIHMILGFLGYSPETIDFWIGTSIENLEQYEIGVTEEFHITYQKK